MTCKDCLCCLTCSVYDPNFNDTLAKNEYCSGYMNKSEWIHLPCKIGDSIYYIRKFCGVPLCGVQKGTIQHITLSSRGWRVKIREYQAHNMDFAIGKTAFFDLKEAEDTLNKMQKEKSHEYKSNIPR